MTKIKNYTDEIREEIHSARDYAEKSLELKAKGNTSWANKYKEMALQELNHAMNIHDYAVIEIEELKKVYTPPADMMEKWQECHNKMVEKVAWIKQMLTL